MTRARGATAEPVVLARPFRPLFLLCGVQAVITVVVWAALLAADLRLPAALPGAWWHAHEMLFGFGGAAVAGFLLTAVPNWTGARALRGRALAWLVGSWLAGRVLMSVHPGAGVGGWLASGVTVSFLAVVAVWVTLAIARARDRRNAGVALILGLLLAAQVAFHLAVLGVLPLPARGIELLAFDALILLMAVIAGRIIPAFGSNWLRTRGAPPTPPAHLWLEVAAFATLAALLVLDVAAVTQGVRGLAAVAAVVHGLRLARWQVHRVRREPLLWVLHLGYAWIVLALALRALAAPPSTWFHAVGIGAMGTLVMGVAGRAALGHTGRALQAPAAMPLAFLLVSLAAGLRLAPTVGLPGPMTGYWLAAAGAWTAAWSLFLVRYAPILTRPRVDGRPG